MIIAFNLLEKVYRISWSIRKSFWRNNSYTTICWGSNWHC